MDQRGFLEPGFPRKEGNVVSFNLVFHIASALACVLLIYALLRLQALVRFHAQLWQSQDPTRRAVQLDWPVLFLQRFGKALDIPLEGTTDKGLPQRIEMKAWVAAHLALGFRRFSFQEGAGLTIETREADPSGAWSGKLEEALGGTVKISLRKGA